MWLSTALSMALHRARPTLVLAGLLMWLVLISVDTVSLPASDFKKTVVMVRHWRWLSVREGEAEYRVNSEQSGEDRCLWMWECWVGGRCCSDSHALTRNGRASQLQRERERG